jgi:hypothetical protein
LERFDRFALSLDSITCSFQAPGRESVFFLAARLLSFLPEAKGGLADGEKSMRTEVREENQQLPTADVCRRLKL